MSWTTAFVICFVTLCATLCFIGYFSNKNKSQR